jgi:hypothetical protein
MNIHTLSGIKNRDSSNRAAALVGTITVIGYRNINTVYFLGLITA